jgi:hypothetical protein
MRKAMICVSVMLALLQLWPMVMGKSVTPAQVASTAAPSAQAAAPRVTKVAALIGGNPVNPIKSANQPAGSAGQVSCYRHYEIAFAACAPSDRACRMKAADQWDLCEATGFWGN